MAEISLATRVQDARTWLEAPERMQELAKALPNGMTPEGFVRVVMTAYLHNPKLALCSLDSMWLTVVQSAQLGLPLDGRFAAAVPFKGRVKFIPMYQGLIQLAYRHPRVLSVEARTIHEKDAFDYAEGAKPRLEHTPARPPRGEVIAAYARAKVRGGGTIITFLWREEIEEDHRAYSQNKDNPEGPWVRNYAAMCCKTAVLVMSKFLPQSAHLVTALSLDGDRDPEQDRGVSLDVPGGTRVEEILDAIAVTDESNETCPVCQGVVLDSRGEPALESGAAVSWHRSGHPRPA